MAEGVCSDPLSPLPQSLLLCGWKRRTTEETPLAKRREEERRRSSRVSLLPHIFDPPLFLPSSPSILSLPIFSEREDSVLSRASVGMGNLCLIANLGSLGESSLNSHSSKMDVC